MKELQQQILDTAKGAIHDAILDSLTGYSSPLKEYANEIVAKYEDEFKSIMNENLSKTIASPEFKKMILEEFQRKIAKNLVGKLEGAVEKAANALRQDQTLRARMIVAIENIVNEQYKVDNQL